MLYTKIKNKTYLGNQDIHKKACSTGFLMGTLYIKVPFQSQLRRFLRTLSSSSTIFVSVVLLKPTGGTVDKRK